jgi:hypothetical protein
VGQATVDCMAYAHCLLATTHRLCNIAFPLQQWLHELASIFRHTYIACLVIDLFLQTEQNVYDCVNGSVTLNLKVILLVCNEVCFEAMHPVICVWTCSILLSHPKFNKPVWNPSRKGM